MTRRRSPGWVPNQHGAWAMLAAPALAGIITSGVTATQIVLTAFWVVGYLAFFATGLWLKSRRRAKWWPPVRTYAVVAAVLGLTTIALQPDLLRWTPLFLVPAAIGLVAYAKRDDRSLISGLSTTVAACLFAPVVHDAGQHQDWPRIWLITLVLALYFVGTVLYVKTMIRERGDRRFLLLSITYHVAALLVVMAIGSLPLTVVFAVLLARAILLPPRELKPKPVGIIETVLTIAVLAAALTLHVAE
ncbi:YwiC-like family protein [Kribbia dieselivorans]|uniref:YwiC-like family protein n=1 Tax=Kribbia dieselivorans TaxID=331526 RepID=UPI0008392741|nr:YwiC-like family protein [Kribbia dieselivorans]